MDFPPYIDRKNHMCRDRSQATAAGVTTLVFALLSGAVSTVHTACSTPQVPGSPKTNSPPRLGGRRPLGS